MLNVFYILNFVVLIGSLSAAFGSYEGYQVIQVVPPFDQMVLDNIINQFNCLLTGITHNGTVQLLVKPNYTDDVKIALDTNGFGYEVLVKNLQLLIENQMANDVSTETMMFDKYNTYEVIKAFLMELENHKDDSNVRCKTEVIGRTSENKPICMIKIYKTRSHCPKRKPAILVDGGIHAREWISPAFVMYLINQLRKNPDKNPMIDDVLDKFDWYLIPLLNPDGYIYTHTADRLWRKNRRKSLLKPECFGVDLNRNFGHMWNPLIGGSHDPCNKEIYAGTVAFSEAESIALKNVMQRKNRYCAYLSFHSYGQYWLYPWGFNKLFPVDAVILQYHAVKATDALTAVFGTMYKVGSVANVLYQAAGSSMDFAKAVAKIKFSYTVELRDQGETGFILPGDQIIPTCKETLRGVLVFAQNLIKTKRL